MSISRVPESSSKVQDKDVFLHLKEIIVIYDDNRRPKSDIVVKFKDTISGFEMASKVFTRAEPIWWRADIYVKPYSGAVLVVYKKQFRVIDCWVCKFLLTFNSGEFGDGMIVERRARNGLCVRLAFATSKPSIEVAKALNSGASSALASKILMLDKLGNILDFLDTLMVVSGSAELNPIAQAVGSMISKALAKVRAIVSCHMWYIDVVNDLAMTLPVMRLALERIQYSESMELVKHFIRCVKATMEELIRVYDASQSVVEEMSRNWYMSQKDDVVRLKDKSSQLKQNLDLSLSFNIQRRATGIQNDLSKTLRLQIEDEDEDEDKAVLRRIKPPGFNSFNPQRCCLDGTRTFVIDAVMSFALSEDSSSRVFWLYGIAGSGKSSVAATVAKKLDLCRRLSGSFFCKRDDPELRAPNHLILALAYAIAKAHSTYRNTILDALKADSQLEDKSLRIQFDVLLREPLIRVSPYPPTEPVIFIIDALDESDDDRVASLLLSYAAALAPWLRLIATSRPLPEIRYNLHLIEEHLITYDLFIEDAHQDIQLFIRSQLSDGPLNDLKSYMDDEQVEALARKSSGLFIWIATILSYVNGVLFGRHAALLESFSCSDASDPEAQLDVLYLRILRSVTGSSSNKRDAAKIILALIYVTSRDRSLPSRAMYAIISRARIPVSLFELDHFLQQMGSVLTVDSRTGVIRVSHPSFLDFIGQEQRSKDFWTRTEDVDAIVAKICFEIMHDGLRFNICGLESSCLRNDEVPDLMERVARHVSQELQYSCMYWLDHLSKSDDACRRNMQSDVQNFLRDIRSLYWLEVLSLMSELKAADVILRNLYTMYKDNTQLRDAVSDYHRFVTLFHDPISISTPHIYTTAALWTPSSSAISNIHATNLKSHALVLDGRHKVWPACLQVIECKEEVTCITYLSDESRIASGFKNGVIRIWDALSGAPIGAPLVGHTSTVWSVSCSPDGLRILSGSEDRTIRIWDARSGASVVEPLRGHVSSVCSVSYSPDGSRIVSGSKDRKIRIWDARSGAPIGPPLEGHTVVVLAVSYSPDGARIVSGSWDRTIRIWDARNGAPIGSPLNGHTASVCSVSYSPDGLHILSGSRDKTIRIWDARSGASVVEPLRGHVSSICSVSYSPDGLRIASGSEDKTIRIWNARSGALIGAPLEGHTSSVCSVSYSPDGSHILSGSGDKTIRIWDVLSAASIGAPLEGHTVAVLAVSYSPDGARIVSGSWDRTIRIWDARSGAAVGEPLRGHTSSVCSVSYSPDGSRILSGSGDKTIRIWDARSGASIGAPLEGHTDSVCSVACSPDGSRLISGSRDRTIRIWDARSGGPIGSPLNGHANSVCSVACSPDGSRLISGSWDCTIRIWDARSGAPIGFPLNGHTNSVCSVACSPDGSRLISGSSDGSIRIWNLRTAASIDEPLEGHTGPINSIAYSSDGTRILSGSEDSTIRIWDAQNGTLIGHPLVGHAGSIMSVTYSPDGSRIASCSSDGTVRVWDARTEDRTASDKSIGDDGWIRNPDGGLLLWVPREFRKGVCDMSLFSLPRDAVGHPIKVDWEGLQDTWDCLNRH